MSLATPAATPSWHREIAEFVLKRKKPTGGFSATPRLPPTIQDTYHSLRILHLLAKHDPALLDPAGGPLQDYLTRESPAERHSAKITFMRLAGLRLAGAEASSVSILDFVRRRVAETIDLEERYYCCRLVREIVGQDGHEFGWLDGQAAPWQFRTATELLMLLTLANGTYPDSEGLTAWLQACQTFDGGFGFLPGTTSFMENCYDCLRALLLLGSGPKNREACLAFILACRTRYGGFSRRHGATAFLSTTWQAMATLELLGSAGGE
jgi:hypothetical protein